MPRLQFVLAMSLVLVSSSFAHQTQFQREVTERRAEVQNVDGSPVRLSDARWAAVTLNEVETAARRRTVKVQNVSGRAIRRVNLMFWFRFAECEWGGSSDAVESLGPDEIREVLHRGSTFFRKPGEEQVLVVLQGVQFENGDVWAPNRRQAGPLTQGLLAHNQTRELLRLLTCTIEDGSYSVMMEVVDPKIESYRLGIVRDTADSFEVKIGKRITLEESQRVRGARWVDNGWSLAADQLFPVQWEPLGLSELDVRCPKHRAGVAFFIAELTFTGGRRWVQDTRRDVLLWEY